MSNKEQQSAWLGPTNTGRIPDKLTYLCISNEDLGMYETADDWGAALEKLLPFYAMEEQTDSPFMWGYDVEYEDLDCGPYEYYQGEIPTWQLIRHALCELERSGAFDYEPIKYPELEKLT